MTAGLKRALARTMPTATAMAFAPALHSPLAGLNGASDMPGAAFALPLSRNTQLGDLAE